MIEEDLKIIIEQNSRIESMLGRLIAAYQELDAEYQRTEGKKSRAVMVWRKLENRFGYSEIHIKRVLAANGIDYRTSIEALPQSTKQLTDNEH